VPVEVLLTGVGAGADQQAGCCEGKKQQALHRIGTAQLQGRGGGATALRRPPTGPGLWRGRGRTALVSLVTERYSCRNNP